MKKLKLKKDSQTSVVIAVSSTAIYQYFGTDYKCLIGSDKNFQIFTRF